MCMCLKTGFMMTDRGTFLSNHNAPYVDITKGFFFSLLLLLFFPMARRYYEDFRVLTTQMRPIIAWRVYKLRGQQQKGCAHTHTTQRGNGWLVGREDNHAIKFSFRITRKTYEASQQAAKSQHNRRVTCCQSVAPSTEPPATLVTPLRIRSASTIV